MRRPFSLRTERVGPFPIINHFLDRLGLDEILDRHVPTLDRRCAIPHGKCLGLFLRSIIVEREPIYRQQETVSSFSAQLFGLTEKEISRVGDDRIGRALDRLFDADRAALLTEVIVKAAREFDLDFTRVHNDSTTIRFQGQYRAAKGREIRGKRAACITYGISKDHRPDLKQLLYCLTSTSDGGVPVQFRAWDGNQSDSTTHIETWKVLAKVAGRKDFLYVADSKLCSRQNMDFIDRQGGRFVTVLPRSRTEDHWFRKRIQTEEPVWEKVWDRPNPRRKGGPRDRWYVTVPTVPSREAWPVVWVFSELLAKKQETRRQERILAAEQDLRDLGERLAGARPRIRLVPDLNEKIEKILAHHRVGRYIRARGRARPDHSFRQMRPGRPGKDTPYRRITKKRLTVDWSIDQVAVDYDRKSDGMYPLLTNDRTMAPADVLRAHKGQPHIEKRFQQIKSVHEIAPVFLKNEGRVEGLFILYFLALVVQALIERELRQEMDRSSVEELPLYPEERKCKRPTTEQVLRLFSLSERHVLKRNEKVVQVFEPALTDLQRQVLALLGVPDSTFRLD